MKNLLIIVCAVVSFNLLYSIGVSIPIKPQIQIIDVGNDRLEACLTKYYPGVITPSEIKKIDCSQYCMETVKPVYSKGFFRIDTKIQEREDTCEINSLKGLEKFTELQELNLSNHNLYNEYLLSNLKDLKNLHTIKMNNANLTALPAIPHNLKVLIVDDNDIDSVEQLTQSASAEIRDRIVNTEYKKLRVFSIRFNKLSSVENNEVLQPFWEMRFKVNPENYYKKINDSDSGSYRNAALEGNGTKLLVWDFTGNDELNDTEKHLLAREDLTADDQAYVSRTLGYDIHDILKHTDSHLNQAIRQALLRDCIDNCKIEDSICETQCQNQYSE